MYTTNSTRPVEGALRDFERHQQPQPSNTQKRLTLVRRYQVLAEVPGQYIHAEVHSEIESDQVEFWGRREFINTAVDYLDSFLVYPPACLHSPEYSEEEAIELANRQRKSMNIRFTFECPCDDSDAAGDWLEEELESGLYPDWHIDEILPLN
ncbi:hypothetical protein [uncultured Microbulbifer sp.]|uniref:hypothetical protein n=1 Tax=uncultured Microbulbifer sp. TaxID=348147 RepID=UPI002626363C|nr:hypothetical protein [uncultured Microbulbifer sp.]